MVAAIVPISVASFTLAMSAVGLLFALHHLRIQPKLKTTATLIFWRQSVQPQRTRVPWARRFSNWPTFVLLSAISLLVAAALTADRWGPIGGRGEQNVIVLDTGAATATVDAAGRTRLDAEIASAINDLRHFAEPPALISAGPSPALLLAAGTPPPVVLQQVKSLTPQPGASAAALALQLAAGVQGARTGHIVWYTSQSHLPDGLPTEVAARVVLRRVAPGLSSEIVGVTYEPDAGDPNHGAVCVSVAGNLNTSSKVEATYGGTTVNQIVTRVGGSGDTRFNDIAANAGEVRLRLGDSSMVTPFRLPDRRPLSFRLIGPAPSALRAALQACGRVSGDGEIAVVPRGFPLPPGMPAAIVIEPSDKPADALLTLVDPVDRPLDLEQARVHRVPAGPMPGTPLMTAGHQTVASLDIAPSRRTLHLADGLVSDSTDLPRRAAFPLLIAAWCNRLVDRDVSAAVVPSLRAAEDPLWPGPDGHGYATTVADRPAMSQDFPHYSQPFEPAGVHASWTTLVLGAALALLAVEGVLFAARKIG